MSKLFAAIVGLVGCAAGLFLGLAVAMLAGGRAPATPDLPSDAAQPALAAAVEPAAQPPEPIDAADWGPLAPLAQNFGPGTVPFRLIERLTEHHEWERNYPNAPPPVALRQIGQPPELGHTAMIVDLSGLGKGRILIEAFVERFDLDGPQFEVVMQYAACPLAADLELALEHRGRVFRLLTEGLEMPENVRRAAQRIERQLLLFRTSDAYSVAMGDFCRHLPKEILARLEDSLRASVAQHRSDFDTPRVGFLLSDRWLMEVIFARDQAGSFHAGRQGVDGNWWSLLLGGPDGGETTKPHDRHGRDSVVWPRLTEVQTAAFLARLPNK